MEEEDSQVDESLADEEDTQSAEWSEEEEKTLVCNFMYAIDLPVTRGVRSLAGQCCCCALKCTCVNGSAARE